MIADIIVHLRQAAPLFAGRVAGGAHLKPLAEGANLAVPCAFVIPAGDSPSDSSAVNAVRQDLEDKFSVVVALDNTVDERGQAAAADYYAARTALWSALVGWAPSARHEVITYDGGDVIAIDRARVWAEFSFVALQSITPADGWIATRDAALSPFGHVAMTVDFPQPDGADDAAARFPKTGDLPQ